MGSSSSPPHALLLPFPAQGHVIPMMELAHSLLASGVDVTFVSTEFNHHRLSAAVARGDRRLQMAWAPDGLEPEDDRDDLGRLIKGCRRVMPGHVEDIVRASRGGITSMITDLGMSFVLVVAEKMGLRRACFITLPAAEIALTDSVPKLIRDGVIDDDGKPSKDELIQLAPGMPPMRTTEFLWNHLGHYRSKSIPFQDMFKDTTAVELSEFFLCNSSLELESPSLSVLPHIIFIGPLITGRQLGRPTASFWPEDQDCLSWLDRQPKGSVIYAAFGSITMFSQAQFEELALGLELSGRSFLWVVRPGITVGSYPVGFMNRVGDRAMMVEWASQHQVLAHPAVGCFLTHCGWNSTMEGVMNAVQFLCWPYFADQFLNQSYICDVWRVGVRVGDADQSGIISRDRIKSRVEELMGDEEMKGRAMVLKERVIRSVSEGGSSSENLNKFIAAIKG